MILAGIDEAGYGPLLGPLVVGCCAFEVRGCDPFGPLPCLWKRLSGRVSKRRSRHGRKVHINDSKQVYSPAVGLSELERAVLGLAVAVGMSAARLEEFLERVSPHVLDELHGYDWYAPAGESFPLESDPIGLKLVANALRVEMDLAGTQLMHLGARVVLEREFNRLVEATRNKAIALFSTTAIHLDWLLRRFADKGLVIFCDRQGGREHYGPLLRLMFDQWALEVVGEGNGRCEYHLSQNGNSVRLIFCERAEANCLPVAVASMLSKYLREALMRRFNAFWQRQVPDLSPTAGYYTDGQRFIADIRSRQLELGIGDDQLVRSR